MGEGLDRELLDRELLDRELDFLSILRHGRKRHGETHAGLGLSLAAACAKASGLRLRASLDKGWLTFVVGGPCSDGGGMTAEWRNGKFRGIGLRPGVSAIMRLREKTAIVTGAASGIGSATVRKFLAEGAKVFATDLDGAALAELSQELPSIATLPGDVSRSEDVEAVVATAVERWGRIDILVNSAGITARTVGEDASIEERWDRVMAVNVKGSMLMGHAVVEAMRASDGGGAIVNVASVMGFAGYPTALPFSDGFNPYPGSKGAVVQLTRDMGVRLAAEGIRVNAVAPGFVHTALTANVTGNPEILETLERLHPAGRMGTAEEVANVIAFLASDEASFVNGAVWMVDGGYSAQ